MKPRLCVFCGSHTGNENRYRVLASRVGIVIGQEGYDLMYGGGDLGLMGVLARTAHFSGAHTTGIVPRQWSELPQIEQERVVVDSVAQRRNYFRTHADAFLALPGGIGTMSEIIDILEHRVVFGQRARPLALFNENNFYSSFYDFMMTLAHTRFYRIDRGLFKLTNTFSDTFTFLATRRREKI